MENDQNLPWERLKTVIWASGAPSTNAFSKSIGLKHPETLYRVERGQNGISKELAKLINAKFPQFDIPWLTCGGKNPPKNIKKAEDTHLVSIPVYEDLGTRRYKQTICLPHTLAGEANMALMMKSGFTEECGQGSSVLLLKRTDNEIKFGDMHLVCTDCLNSMCIVNRCKPKEKVVLSPIRGNLFSDILIDRSTIRELYLVCGFFTL